MKSDFVPFEKLSKKEKRKRNSEKRGTWFGLNPVTRVPTASGAYSRAGEKAKLRKLSKQEDIL